jgi:hypothetical protein
MTEYQKTRLNGQLKSFNSFTSFHSYAYKNDIIFDHDEWQEYKKKMFKILKFKNSTEEETSIENIDFSGLILP